MHFPDRLLLFYLMLGIIPIINQNPKNVKSIIEYQNHNINENIIKDSHWTEKCLNYSEWWYTTEEAQRIVKNVIHYQNKDGGWPKNIDMDIPFSNSKKIERLEMLDVSASTIDNLATFTQLRFLAKVYYNFKSDIIQKSFLKGIDYLIDAQYENGGWPQYYPLRDGYYSHITFNDEAMIGVLSLFKDVLENPDKFPALDVDRKEKINGAVEKGIECVLSCQVKINAHYTVWCAQHDEHTLLPVKARSYELPSLSGKESVGILVFLMSIENPNERIIEAIQCGVEWFSKSFIKGLRKTWVASLSNESNLKKIIVNDSDAPPIWGRFYELNTNKYFFCDRDGSVHYNLNEISEERRNGYGWLGYWPNEMLTNIYPDWQKKYSPERNVIK